MSLKSLNKHSSTSSKDIQKSPRDHAIWTENICQRAKGQGINKTFKQEDDKPDGFHRPEPGYVDVCFGLSLGEFIQLWLVSELEFVPFFQNWCPKHVDEHELFRPL